MCQPALFFTREGYMGLGPLDLKVGDSVCLLFGGLTPYILRDIGEGCHQFIGEAYVHGIMHGEGMRDCDAEEFALR